MKYLWAFLVYSIAIGYGEETVYLKNGKFQKGKILSQTNEGFTFEFKRAEGNEDSKIEILWQSVNRIEFPTTPLETEAIRNPGKTEISTYVEMWKKTSPWLSRPESKAAAIGLAYAQKLLDSSEAMAPEQALDLFEHIAKSAWNPQDQVAGVRGKLKTLLKMGKELEAIREAEALAEATENPSLLLEAKSVLASNAFDRLKTIEAENPRWILDDEVRPTRDLYFNTAIDHSLFPYLFYGSEEVAAAGGLYHAAEIYEYTKDFGNAKLCVEDILKLYPNSKFNKQAQDLLNRISGQLVVK